MSKEDIRKAKRGKESNAGNFTFEMTELKKIHRNGPPDDASTITLGCSEILTIICC